MRMGSGSLVPALLDQEPGTVTVAPMARAQDAQRRESDFITDMMFPPLKGRSGSRGKVIPEAIATNGSSYNIRLRNSVEVFSAGPAEP